MSVVSALNQEQKTSNFCIIKRNNTLTTIIKQLIDSKLDNDHVLYWTHTEVSEWHGSTKVI